jgi:hypothetical protein
MMRFAVITDCALAYAMRENILAGRWKLLLDAAGRLLRR